MARKQPVAARKKYFNVAQANATLPLVRTIVRDVTELARNLLERQDRLRRIMPTGRETLGEAHREEILHIQADMERDQDRMLEYQQELEELGIELKDYQTGLIDFPCRMDGRDVYLCWRLGESEVAYWHELDTGFAGRRRLVQDPAAR